MNRMMTKHKGLIMVNLNEMTLSYIETTYLDAVKPVIYKAFSLLEELSDCYYEDKYSDLLARYSISDKDTIRDNFTKIVMADLVAVAKGNYITISLETEVTLIEIVEICEFISLIPKLEDYSVLEAYLDSDEKNKYIVASLVSIYTKLSESRALELIEEVDDAFIRGIKNYVADTDRNDISPIDTDRVKEVNYFFSYIGPIETIGLVSFREGYISLAFKDLIDHLGSDVSTRIEELVKTDLPKASLEVFSLAMISIDGYIDPLKTIKENIIYITPDNTSATRLINILERMVGDYMLYRNVVKGTKGA